MRLRNRSRFESACAPNVPAVRDHDPFGILRHNAYVFKPLLVPGSADALELGQDRVGAEEWPWLRPVVQTIHRDLGVHELSHAVELPSLDETKGLKRDLYVHLRHLMCSISLVDGPERASGESQSCRTLGSASKQVSMELAGLEPATPWVRCGELASSESRRVRLYRAESSTTGRELNGADSRGLPEITFDSGTSRIWCPNATDRLTPPAIR
jgi:hypothetical protein